MFHPLVIGCPLWKREWIMPEWFEAVEQACVHASVEPAYLFVADPRDPTVAVIDDIADDLDAIVYYEWIEESPDLTTKRNWSFERFERMVYLRNTLLNSVRALRPAYFLSLDSDILLHPQAIESMIQFADTYDAVGGKTYMTPTDRVAPSYGMIAPHSLKREDTSNVMEVDVIMAIKLMTPDAYNVDYENHQMGEDIGWSLACRRNGLRLGWDGTVTSKHVMKPEMMEKIDERCGF